MSTFLRKNVVVRAASYNDLPKAIGQYLTSSSSGYDVVIANVLYADMSGVGQSTYLVNAVITYSGKSVRFFMMNDFELKVCFYNDTTQTVTVRNAVLN